MTTPAPTKVILDCDPGHDDAVAILLAAGNPAIDILAITTVAGNQTLEKVTHNALAIATIAGLHVPVAAGARYPLLRDAHYAPDIHGESGLDGATLPEPTVTLDPRHGVDVIIETIMAEEPGTVTLVPTGPLTNIALAVRKAPEIVSRVREVVLMGGGALVGNVTPVAEFNIWFDPDAAHIVFSAGWKLTMVGLDVTHQALATSEVAERVAAVGTAKSVFASELIAAFGLAYKDAQGFDAPPVHDPCAVALVIDPTLFDIRRAPIQIELTGTHTLGMTVTDLRQDAPEDCPTSVALGLDADRFWDLVIDALR